jgi:hypothetical protein
MKRHHCLRILTLLALTTLLAASAGWTARERAKLLRVQGLVKVKPVDSGRWFKAILPQSSSLAERDEVQTYQ